MKRRIAAALLALGLLAGSASALTAEQAGEALRDYYIDEIPEDILSLPTVQEMLDALGDPYTIYYEPADFTDFMDSMEDTEVMGIGIRVYIQEDGLLLSEVAQDSPAQKAGLLPGDLIVAVDGKDTRGAPEDSVMGWIQGEAGTSVRVTVLREGRTFTVSMVRQAVTFPTVTLDKIEDRVGWITCTAFGSTTYQHFYDIISANDDQVDEWVVDLRENGGGDVYASLFSAGCFTGWGSGVYLRNGSGDYSSLVCSPQLLTSTGYYNGDLSASAYDSEGFLTSDPVFVLTGPYTASASELFCAMIRDSGAGLIVGDRTFGKGVVQTVFSAGYHPAGMEGWFDDGSALRVTTEQCYCAEGGTYERFGVLPHLLVDPDLADEVAALLSAPVGEDEDALFLRRLGSNSTQVNSLILPLDRLRDPANAGAVEQILSALPVGTACQLRQNGAVTPIDREAAARLCGVALQTRRFSDTARSDYQDEIDTLGTFGLVRGTGGGTFQPEAALTRSQLCALLVQAMRCPVPRTESPFPDVAEDAWYAPSVKAMYAAGLMAGCDDGLFHPDDPVSHEQFIAVLSRAARRLNMDYRELALHDGLYGDMMPGAQELAEQYSGYAPWAREAVWLCGDELLWTDMDRIDPAVPTVREEAAAALFRLLRVSGSL